MPKPTRDGTPGRGAVVALSGSGGCGARRLDRRPARGRHRLDRRRRAGDRRADARDRRVHRAWRSGAPRAARCRRPAPSRGARRASAARPRHDAGLDRRETRRARPRPDPDDGGRADAPARTPAPGAAPRATPVASVRGPALPTSFDGTLPDVHDAPSVHRTTPRRRGRFAHRCARRGAGAAGRRPRDGGRPAGADGGSCNNGRR